MIADTLPWTNKEKEGGTENTFELNLILALGVAYFVRLEAETRMDFARAVITFFEGVRNPAFFMAAIAKCQDLFLDELHLEMNIAKNDALKVTIFSFFKSPSGNMGCQKH